jgi:nucleotide-binding universal stress UspA family protein
MCGAAGTWPRPFAVGVLALADPDDPNHAEARRAGRLDVALDAYKDGYFLIDTVETGDREGGGYPAIEALAARTGADALVVRGSADRPRLESVAARCRLMIIYHPA